MLSMGFPTDTDIDVNNNNKRNTTQFKEKLALFVVTVSAKLIYRQTCANYIHRLCTLNTYV